MTSRAAWRLEAISALGIVVWWWWGSGGCCGGECRLLKTIVIRDPQVPPGSGLEL